MTRRQFLRAAFAGICQEKMVQLSLQADLGRQYYHAVTHPFDVYRGARRVGICLLGEAQYAAIDDSVFMASMGHDVIQDAEEVLKDGFAYRARKRERNETANADWAAQTLHDLRERIGYDTVSNAEIGDIHMAILWTIPGWSPEFGTVIQPRLWEALKEGKHFYSIPIAVAMGDLLSCGHHPQAFLAASDALFVEEWLGIERLLRGAKHMSDVPSEDRKSALELMRAWDNSQIKFVRGRQQAFDYEASLMPIDVQERLRARINKFEETAERARWRAESRMALNFFEYASVMGFKDVPTTF